jgi:O-antigen/teichoic acid export membrane protein
MRDVITIWLRRAEVDRSVLYGLLISLFQLLSAPLTILLITRHLTAEMQGFYYTFGSLLALRSFVELGLYVVILNLASHEWAHLKLDDKGQIVGDAGALSRLISLGRFVFKWYALGSAIFVILIGVVGHSFLSNEGNQVISWIGPWWTLVFLSGLLMWSLPFNSLLEGCDQVKTIQKFRLSETILRNLSLWIALMLDGQLWVLVASTTVSLIFGLYLLTVKYKVFFSAFLCSFNGKRIDWRSEIFPMQWRLALGGIFSYLLFQMFNPVMFYYHGSVVAGQMGMTMSVASAILGIAMNWITPKVPTFGMLIARKDYVTLDHLWLKTTKISLIVATLCALLAWLLLFGIKKLEMQLADRLLSPFPAGMLFIAIVFMSVGYCQTVYLRAHKKEPLVTLSLVTSLLMGILVLILGERFGASGAAGSYLLVMGGVSLPWQTLIFLRCRNKWHKD